MRVIYVQTPAGKPKIVNAAGFTLAIGVDAEPVSQSEFRRLIALWNAAQHIPLEELEQIAESPVGQEALREFIRSLVTKPKL